MNQAPDPADITLMLMRLRNGEQEAFDELFPVVYHRLKTLAHIQRSRWEGDDELNPPALVHEAYLKPCGQKIASNARVCIPQFIPPSIFLRFAPRTSS